MINETFNNASVRHIEAEVELYSTSASSLVDTYSYTDNLVSFNIERIGEESKFFGFGICQKVNVKLRDKNREINVSTDNFLKTYINNIDASPVFIVTEVNRDENTNQLSITAYDKIHKASKLTVSDLELVNPYTLREVAAKCASALGCTLKTDAISAFDTVYSEGANFDGSEDLRSVLNAIAEATQTIYYINNNEEIYFKRLDLNGEAVLTIGKEDYFVLSSKTNRRLSTIVSATELGDNVSASTPVSGSTQYVRDNPFWELREDIAELVDAAIAAVGGLTINQFDCDWRGNYLLEPGDKIDLITKDDDVITAYVINDTISYNGALTEKTSWSYTDNKAETANNPTTLGEALKKTYARVDKANKQIDLVASEADSNKAAISALQITTDSINASVTNIDTKTTEALENANAEISNLKSSVEAQISAEDVTIAIQTELENGVTTVKTATGYTFNGDGLTISKSNSEMSTQITDDGMTVSKNEEVVLTANNVGVDAVNLHATTYLIVGSNSRFEDYGSGRTGCFWIGG